MKPFLLTSIIVIGWSSLASAQVSGRKTDSILRDTTREMIAERAFDDAAWYTHRIWKRSDAESDVAALAAIERFRVLVSSLQETGTLNSKSLAQSASEVIEFFDSYPDHRRIHWWRAAERAAEREIAEAAIARVLIGDPESSAQSISRNLVEIASRVEDLRSEIQDDRERLSRDRVPIADDLISLDRQLAIESLRLSIGQIELCPNQSDEQIAAASTAVSQAESTLETLPGDSAASQTVTYWLAVALHRAGQRTRSRSLLETVGGRPNDTLALKIEIDLAEGKIDAAEKQLTDFYGDDFESAPRSLAMDLARLKFLMLRPSRDSNDSSNRAGNRDAPQWLETMGRRGGRYAARRGEAVLLAGLPQGPVKDGIRTGSNELVAIQGRKWVRQGDAVRGGHLLASAAAAESDAKSACQFAIESASAFTSVKQPEAVAKVLLETARRFRTETAAVLHYQGIHASLSHQEDPQIELLLQEHLGLFPRSAHRESVRQWLVGIFDQTGRAVDAAIYSIGPDADHRWRKLFTATNADTVTLSATLRESIEMLSSDKDRIQRTQLVLEIADLDRGLLGQGTSLPALSARAQSIMRFRSGETEKLDVSPSVALTAALVRDGQKAKSRRKAVARYVVDATSKATTTADRIVALIWLGRDKEALSLANQSATGSAQAAELHDLAASLGQSSSPPLKKRAVELFDTLAAGLPRGTERWHEVKWAAISLLADVAPQESQKRSKYLLLTENNLPTLWQDRYEQAASRAIEPSKNRIE